MTARKTQADTIFYSSAEAFIVAWPEIPFDLVFIDIQMKDMNGIQLSELIRRTDKNILLVFVTSFTQYVLKGYNVDALHYLIKPISIAKLMPVLDKANMIFCSRQNDFLLVSDGTGQVKLPYDSIFYISMFSHTAEIHTTEEIYTLRKTTAELTDTLPSYFVRYHRSLLSTFSRPIAYIKTL